jgi:hypothetical protein
LELPPPPPQPASASSIANPATEQTENRMRGIEDVTLFLMKTFLPLWSAASGREFCAESCQITRFAAQ